MKNGKKNTSSLGKQQSPKWIKMQNRMIKGYEDNVFNDFGTKDIFKYTLEFQPAFGKILDVGCYDCRFKEFIKGDIGVDYYGLDPIDKGIEKVRVGFAEEMPFPDDFFDIVYIISTFDHFENPKKAIDECYRVLKESGHLVLVNTIQPKLHIKEYTKEELLSFLKGEVVHKIIGNTLFAKSL